MAIQARREETAELANSKTLKELATDARFSIGADALMSAEEKSSRQKWLLKILQDAVTTEEDKKIIWQTTLNRGK